jgi:asparagine synthase (glutamine-hydrolysing)
MPALLADNRLAGESLKEEQSMCGIGGVTNLGRRPCPDLARVLAAMNELQRHRGPDGQGVWMHPCQSVGFAHRRLSIIDIDAGRQPMHDGRGNWVTSRTSAPTPTPK